MKRRWIFSSDTVWKIYYHNGRFNSVRKGGMSHKALDLCAALKTVFFAPEDGVVSYQYIEKYADGTKPYNSGWLAWCSYPYGGVCVFEGASGVTYLFCHMDPSVFQDIDSLELMTYEMKKNQMTAKVVVSRKLKVKAGDIIGFVGNKGQSTEPHIHLEVWGSNGRIDPESIWGDVNFVNHYDYKG